MENTRRFASHSPNNIPLLIHDVDPQATAALRSDTARSEVPMESTGLEFDMNIWCAGLREDMFLEAIKGSLLSAAESFDEDCLEALLKAMDGRRNAKIGDRRRSTMNSAFMVVNNYSAIGHGENVHFKSSRSKISALHSDGLNVFSRNSLRLLREREATFAQGATVLSLFKELVKAADELGLPPIFQGDGAPMIWTQNQRRSAIYQKIIEIVPTLPKRSEEQLPKIPTCRAEMSRFLLLNEAEREVCEALPQHIPHPTKPGVEIANPAWLTLRSIRFTASMAASIITAKGRDLSAPQLPQYLKHVEKRITDEKLNTWDSCRPPIRSKIKPIPFSNAYTRLGK